MQNYSHLLLGYGYLFIMVPVLSMLMRFARESKNQQNLYKLIVQCMERMVTLAPKEMKQLLGSTAMPPEVAQEIQMAAKAKEAEKKKLVQPTQQKLSINFAAYTQ